MAPKKAPKVMSSTHGADGSPAPPRRDQPAQNPRRRRNHVKATTEALTVAPSAARLPARPPDPAGPPHRASGAASPWGASMAGMAAIDRRRAAAAVRCRGRGPMMRSRSQRGKRRHECARSSSTTASDDRYGRGACARGALVRHSQRG